MPTPEASKTALVASVRQALAERAPERFADRLAQLAAPALADLLESLYAAERGPVWRFVPTQVKGEVLVEVHGEVRHQLIELSTGDELADAVQRLDLDELSDLYAELPPAVADAVLRAMDTQRRERFDLVRRYPADTAGGLMDVDAIAVRPEVTLGMVLDYLARYRQEQGRLPEELDSLSVVDLDGRHVGQLALSDLVSLGAEPRVQDVMDAAFEPIPAQTSAARVARLFEDRDLLSAPVVDDAGRLIGRITVDDVLDFVRDQAEHTVMAGAGLDQRTDTLAPAWSSARRRAVWLGINLVNALVAAGVISMFGGAIERLVALAVLMPIVVSMGGVAGTQSLTLVIRGLALEQVTASNRWPLLRRELIVALLNGLLWASVMALLANAWFGNAGLSVVFAAAVVLNLLAGVAAGTLIPFVLERLKLDPVLAGEVILVAFTDIFGFFVFLGMAAWLLA
jgi:magnesium transporter